MARFESKDSLQSWISSCLDDPSDLDALEFIYQFICERDKTPFPARTNKETIVTIQRIDNTFILPAEIDKSFVQEICGFYLRKKARQQDLQAATRSS